MCYRLEENEFSWKHQWTGDFEQNRDVLILQRASVESDMKYCVRETGVAHYIKLKDWVTFSSADLLIFVQGFHENHLLQVYLLSLCAIFYPDDLISRLREMTLYMNCHCHNRVHFWVLFNLCLVSRLSEGQRLKGFQGLPRLSNIFCQILGFFLNLTESAQNIK